MMSNQQNLNQVGIDEFLCALQSLGVKKDEISGEPQKIKYKNVAPYGAVHEKVDEAENIEKEEVRPPDPKQPSQTAKKWSSLQKGKGFIHKPFGCKPKILYVY